MARIVPLILACVVLLTGCTIGGSNYTSSFFATEYRNARDANDQSGTVIPSSESEPKITGENIVTEEKKHKIDQETDNISFMYEKICYDTEDTPVEKLDNDAAFISALAFNINTTKILYSKSMHEKVYPASTTKLMTALIAIKHCDMEDIVTIEEDNCGITVKGAQLCGFSAGDTLTVRDLLHCLLVYSGNDAALAIAKHVGGTERQFVRMMNSEAKELGCINTSFVNPHGLHDPNHYTTAYDMYLIFNECLRYDALKEIFKSTGYTVTIHTTSGPDKSLYMEPTNLYFMEKYRAPYGITVHGGKTGDTVSAGKCLMLYSEDYDGQGFITEIFGTETKDELYTSMNRIFNYILQPTT
ncbi:MAG: serine hydrolase [Lachnospiraceae bacterium]|nr:serine hydrolase [Lachnospiraceae bacterium]